MTSARTHIAVTLTAIGVLVVVDTLLLLYLGRSIFPSQSVLSLTAGFIVLQEAILFGVLIYIAITAGTNSVALPIQLGYVGVLITCLIFALFIIAVFDLLLMLEVVSLRAFWVALAMRQSTMLILFLSVHIVGVVQRASSRQAEQKRSIVEDAVRACHQGSIAAQLAGWNLEMEFRRASEKIRFCEELRIEQPLLSEVLAKLSELTSIAKAGGGDKSKAKVQRLLSEITMLSS